MLLNINKIQKTIYTVIGIMLLICCKSSMISNQKKAESIYNTNIAIVETFIKVGYIEKVSTLSDSIEFLEKLTHVKSDFKDQFQMFYTPTNENLKNWKKWFKVNKNKLYWDDIENKVKIR